MLGVCCRSSLARVAQKSLSCKKIIQKHVRRNLSIHEYLSANLLKSYGVGVPNGFVAKSAQEAEEVAKKLGVKEMVVKAQVLAGGRGKGSFDNGFKGGVQMANSPTQVRELAGNMIGHKLITKQTGKKGRICNSVFVVERKYAEKEFYLALLNDRASQRPMIVASSQGGMDIETVAKENPDAIIKVPIDRKIGLTDEQALSVASKLGFRKECLESAKDTIVKLYRIFTERDSTQIEINPLSETKDGEVLCMDAKFGFDDNADFRQKEIFHMRDKSQEDPFEVEAAEYGLNFINLDGNIGCLVNGAGLAMATMDIIKLSGGSPANFLDIGGGAKKETIRKAFEILSSDEQVKAIFVNIFGGIVRADDVANGLVETVKEIDLKIPVVARLLGTNSELAREIIAKSGVKIIGIDGLAEAAQKSVELVK